MGIEHYFSHGLYAKKMQIPAGYKAVSHRHNHPHLSVLAAGRVIVDVEGEMTHCKAGDCIEIAAGLAHEITAVEDSIWFCIHATEETDSEKVDAVLIQEA